MTWTTLSSSTPTTWTTQVASTTSSWGSQFPVSVETRLNRIYPQTEAKGIVPFIWQVETEGSWFVATSNGIQVRSSITELIY